MRIKSFKCYKKDLGTKRPYTIAFKTVSEVFSAIVEIELENGIVGYGAGNPSQQVVGESMDDCMSELGKVGFLIGKDIRNFYNLLSEVEEKLPAHPAARATMDIALHDAFTKYLGVPLGHFLGQKIESLPTSITIGIKNISDTLIEAEEYYDLGFRIIKVKTGLNVEEDIARVVKIRERFKSEVLVRVDANQGYSQDQLDLFYQQTKGMVELIEQPLPAAAVEEMKALPVELKEVIAADESLINPNDAFVLANSPKAAQIFNIKLMKSGGIYPAQKIASIAKHASIDLMWGCNDESTISISAALHVALSFSNTKYLDLDGSLDVLEDVLKGGFSIDNGNMKITDKPGLGVY